MRLIKCNELQQDPVLDVSQDTISKEDLTISNISGILQDVFFDLYGTNIPRERLTEIIDAIPNELPNDQELLSAKIVAVLRTLRCHEWAEPEEENLTAPEDLMNQIDEYVNSGEMLDQASEELDDIELFDEDITEEDTEEQEILDMFNETKDLPSKESSTNGFAIQGGKPDPAVIQMYEMVKVSGELSPSCLPTISFSE